MALIFVVGVQDLACVNVFVAGVCCLGCSLQLVHFPNLFMIVCLFVFSFISSVPSGQFWHLDRKTLCIPHGPFTLSSELEMGL